MKKYLKKLIDKSEKGQAIILVALAIVGLIAMVGLVTDTGLLLIEYGKLKRSVDAAAISAAQQYRSESGSSEINKVALKNAAINFLNLNQVQNIIYDGENGIKVFSCEDAPADRPALCNPDPINHPEDNRKLVEVTASSEVRFGFLRVLGFESVTLTATSVGEAVTLDLVLILDTSSQMSYETGNEPNCSPGANPNSCLRPEADDDPRICNAASRANPRYPSKPWQGICQPMLAVKEVALEFIETMYFPYDRASIITFTSQVPGGGRDPVELTPLTSNKDEVVDKITKIKVFQPQECDGVIVEGEGSCIQEVNGDYIDTICEIYELAVYNEWYDLMDPSSCPSSNIGGTLRDAANALQGSNGKAKMRTDSFWVVLLLSSGPANASYGNDDFPYGFCPRNTWPPFATNWVTWCRDAFPSTRHNDKAVVPSYVFPPTGETFINLSIYDADDYARDMADQLARLISPRGVTIYTIGLGAAVDDLQRISGSNVFATNPQTGQPEPPPAEALLKYIATEAGGSDINHGQYFYAPDRQALSAIFDRIAKNIATKISQ